MDWFHISLFFHLLGVGMIFTLLFAGPIIEANFRWENDIRMKQHSAKMLRSVGLLSPFGALVLILSGIGNMIFLNINIGDLFGAYAWLGIKLFFFIILLGIGMVVSPKTARQRAMLLDQMNQINPPEDANDKLEALNSKQTVFFVLNWVLVVIIVLITLFKP
jgi:uncharacterized membrane protein SirB2